MIRCAISMSIFTVIVFLPRNTLRNLLGNGTYLPKLRTLFAVGIVNPFLVLIGKHIISKDDLLEPGGGFRRRILVWMPD